MIGAGNNAGGIYPVDLHQASNETIATSYVTEEVLSDSHSKIAHADRNTAVNMAQSAAVRGPNMTTARFKNNSLSCLQIIMMNSTMRSPANLWNETKSCDARCRSGSERSVSRQSQTRRQVHHVDTAVWRRGSHEDDGRGGGSHEATRTSHRVKTNFLVEAGRAR